MTSEEMEVIQIKDAWGKRTSTGDLIIGIGRDETGAWWYATKHGGGHGIAFIAVRKSS